MAGTAIVAKGAQMRITLHSVDEKQPADTRAIVKFRIARGVDGFVIPVEVDLRQIDEGDLVRVARRELHRMLTHLSGMTADWDPDGGKPAAGDQPG